jgi:twitching motility protein PilT
LVKRIGGGRVVVRELLVNTPAVASLLAEGRTSQLHAMIASRDSGMVPLNDVLAGLVSGGVVDAREACAAAADPAALRTQLGQRGIDISGLEQFA